MVHNNIAFLEIMEYEMLGLVPVMIIACSTFEKVRKREVILRGCIVGPENCYCNNCGYEWKNRNGNNE